MSNASRSISKLTTPLCVRDFICLPFFNVTEGSCIDGSQTKTWRYEYSTATCPQEAIAQYQHQTSITCMCIEEPLRQCMPEMQNSLCDSRFSVLIVIQLLALFIGIALNAIIIKVFFTRRSIQEKIVNVLLVNQAIADVVNLALFALPNSLLLLYMLITKRFTQRVVNAVHATVVLTVASSVLLFVIIAFERFLALHNPIWHKVKIQKRSIYKSVLIAWLVSACLLIFDISTVICGNWEGQLCKKPSYYFHWMIRLLLGGLILIVIVLFLLTFIKALRAIRSRATQLAKVEHVKAKLQLKLTIIFLTMFLCFITGFAFVLIGASIPKETLLAKIFFSLFNLTSIFNPMWTMFQKKEFRLRNVVDEVNTPKQSNTSGTNLELSERSNEPQDSKDSF